MNTVYVDSNHSDDVRRAELFRGQIYVFSPRASTRALCDFARTMIEEAFEGIDPLKAQYQMPVEKYVEICAPLKPRFIHHPKTKGLVRDIVEDIGCDLQKTYQDVPRLRMVTSDGYLTSGVGYAHHPHRDTWYSAPFSQMNWWLPIYPFATESSMAFHPQYWDKAVQNSSREFNYYEWNTVGRKTAATQVKTDTRKQPKAEEAVQMDPQTRFVTEPGGIILFSAAHLHSTVANTSGLARYSIDFRTAHWNEISTKGGAPNVDSACTGTSLRDFLKSADLAPIPDEIIDLYDQDRPSDGQIAVFNDQAAEQQIGALASSAR